MIEPRFPELEIGRSHEGGWAWRPATAPNPHLLVAGTSGAGKSVLLRALAARVERAGVPVIVVDLEGDWRGTRRTVDGLAGSLNLLDVEASGDELRLRRIELADTLAAGAGLGEIQRGDLRNALQRLDATADHRDLVEALEPGGLKVRLEPLAEAFRAPATSAATVGRLLAEGGVVDLSRVPQSVRSLAALLLLSRVYYAARSWAPVDRGVRAVVILDEAHRLAGKALRQAIEVQVREARKRGLALWFGTQSGADLGDRIAELVGSVALLRQRSSGRALAALGVVDSVQLPSGRSGRLSDLKVGEAAWWVPGQVAGLVTSVRPEGTDLPAQLDAAARLVLNRRQRAGLPGSERSEWAIPAELRASVASLAGGRLELTVGRWQIRQDGDGWRARRSP